MLTTVSVPKLTNTKAVQLLKTNGTLPEFQSHLLQLLHPKNPLYKETTSHYYSKTHGMQMAYNQNIGKKYNPKIHLLIWMRDNSNKIINKTDRKAKDTHL